MKLLACDSASSRRSRAAAAASAISAAASFVVSVAMSSLLHQSRRRTPNSRPSTKPPSNLGEPLDRNLDLLLPLLHVLEDRFPLLGGRHRSVPSDSARVPHAVDAPDRGAGAERDIDGGDHGEAGPGR